MFFFEQYFYTVVYFDFINTFFYRDIKQIPKLKKIILNFGHQKANLKFIIAGLLALEILSFKKSKLTESKRLNVFLKIKKGNPVGCKVVLYKHMMYLFYFKLATIIFPKIQNFQADFNKHFLKSISSISITIKNPLLFAELESQYQFFKNLPSLNVTLVTSSRSNNELLSFSRSIKFVKQNFENILQM